MINILRRHISLRRRSVLWPWYICALVCMSQDEFLEKSVGKVNPLRTSCVLAFSPFSLFWPVWSVHMSSCHSHVHFSTSDASLNETLIDWLVVSNIFYFPFHIWDVILPIDFHIIRGVGQPPVEVWLFVASGQGIYNFWKKPPALGWWFRWLAPLVPLGSFLIISSWYSSNNGI